MPIVPSRALLWIGRLLYVAVALWWPAIWRDPIYTPRQARMAGQELRLADGASPKTAEERALAIFWAWEHRQFVETRWVVGPYLGLRSGLYGGNRTGLHHTLLALIAIWIFFGALLGRRNEGNVPTRASSRSALSGTRAGLMTVPLWQLVQRFRS
ncbi:MAG: hypothetical protein FJ147_11675 [Deltaproteobacteria bacterium]|nr:hypothetical protein [Deltaproteobacteria bacterium]